MAISIMSQAGMSGSWGVVDEAIFRCRKEIFELESFLRNESLWRLDLDKKIGNWMKRGVVNGNDAAKLLKCSIVALEFMLRKTRRRLERMRKTLNILENGSE